MPTITHRNRRSTARRARCEAVLDVVVGRCVIPLVDGYRHGVGDAEPGTFTPDRPAPPS